MHSGEPEAHDIFAQDDSEGLKMTAGERFSATRKAPPFQLFDENTSAW
jgi:hypothetical protein